MPISKIDPICEFENFDCIVEAKCNRINCVLACCGRANVEHNTDRVPYKGEKHGWFASNRSYATKKLMTTATGSLIVYSNEKAPSGILKSRLELAHNEGCANVQIPASSPGACVKETSLQSRKGSKAITIPYRDAKRPHSELETWPTAKKKPSAFSANNIY